MANELLANGWTVALGVVLAILILLAMVTIHEFGHYVVGKLLKFRIDEFSVGFGPAIFKHKSKKTGELFAVRIFPLGGYCAFAGEDGLDEEAEKTTEAPAVSEDPFPETQEDTPAEQTDAAASEEATSSSENLHPAAPNADSDPQNTDPAPRNETAPSSEISEEAPKKEPSEEGKAVEPQGGKFTEMAPWKRILVLIAGAFMNYLLALVLILIMMSCYGQSVLHVRGVETSADYPAAYSFREGDILLSANGKELYLTTDLSFAINHKEKGEIVKFRVSRIQEDGSRKEEVVEIMLRGDVSVKNSSDFTGVWGALGIGIEELEDGKYYMLSSTSYRFGFFGTIGHSFAYSFKIAGSIFRVIGELLTGRLGIGALGGPVTTIKMTSEIAVSGMRNFLEIAAYIGVNLAVFNLLPIPALDGSKVVFTAIEWVRGKPISRKVEAIIHAVGFVLLLAFALLVDLLQFI